MADSSPNHSIYEVFTQQRSELLIHLLTTHGWSSTAIFCRTRDQVHTLTSELRQAGFDVDSLHGSKKDTLRQPLLSAFAAGNLPIIVLTDAIGRDIDLGRATQLINYGIPELHSDYTSRQASPQSLVTLTTPEEAKLVTKLESHLGETIPKETASEFDYDTTNLAIKSRRNATAKNTTKTRGPRSKPLQNKKQKLQRKKR